MVECTIDSEALEVLTHAADCWRNELLQYVIPASEEAGDPDSVESQEAEAEAIVRATVAAERAEQAHTQVTDLP